ncbi:hypothetical protein NVP1170O_128 [Vibrio phage 1.170.O._10N.261.52.C3]|nr:hypothetical protein NVP1170O_128 [Vibrio phage 1.170.O._10N.261.52.C3]
MATKSIHEYVRDGGIWGDYNDLKSGNSTCPNKGGACYCTGECNKPTTQAKILYRPDTVTFAGGYFLKSNFVAGQKVFNKGSRLECEFLAYDPTCGKSCYIRYGVYNVQRVKLEDVEVLK